MVVRSAWNRFNAAEQTLASPTIRQLGSAWYEHSTSPLFFYIEIDKVARQKRLKDRNGTVRAAKFTGIIGGRR
jgi:hypothetical protein